jgi:tetratricopeptide (TPR) repeat protein
MRPCSGRFAAIAAALIFAGTLGGCSNDALKANQQQLEQQQGELDQLKKDVAALQAQHPPAYSTAPSNTSNTSVAGGCDKAVMQVATRKGGERFAASDFNRALGYYQDALSACPASAQAQLNVARTFEAMGDRDQAIAHYKVASAATGPNDRDAAREARDAIARLNGST